MKKHELKIHVYMKLHVSWIDSLKARIMGWKNFKKLASTRITEEKEIR